MKPEYIAIGGLIVMILIIGVLIVIGGIAADKRRMCGGEPAVTMRMGPGHPLPDMLKGKSWRPSQMEINTAKYAQEDRQLEPFKRWIDEHNSNLD